MPQVITPCGPSGGGGGVSIAEMWFDVGLFADSLVSIPSSTGTSVTMANTNTPDAALFTILSLNNPNDTLSLESTSHLYLVSGSARWNTSGFAQQVVVQGAGASISAGTLYGDISLHAVHPADYFTVAQPIAGVIQGNVDYGLFLPLTAGYQVSLYAYQETGSAKNLRRGVLTAVAFPLA